MFERLAVSFLKMCISLTSYFKEWRPSKMFVMSLMANTFLSALRMHFTTLPKELAHDNVIEAPTSVASHAPLEIGGGDAPLGPTGT